jgi:glycosyltransferase involved in cell wall biosynthesis
LIWHVASDSNVVAKRRFTLPRHAHKLLDRKLFKYGVGHAHHIIVQTNYQKNLLKSLNNEAKISLIRNFHPFPDEKPLEEKKNQIIWVANFKTLKQPELFIDLSETLNEKRINVQCIMIGSPASTPPRYQQLLEKRINQIPNLIWLKKQPIQVVNEYINESKLFINTSKWEGFPNTYIQAWMRETPVVALTCDPDNLIKDYKIGMHSKSYSKLVDDVITLLQNDKKRISIGKKAKEYSFKYHSLINRDQLIEIFLQSK